MKYEITDPAGLKHTVELVEGAWHGAENIAHTFEPNERREVSRILLGLLYNPGAWRGFTWRPA